jgi:hypothetical protein
MVPTTKKRKAPATCGLPPGRVPWKVQLPGEMPDLALSCVRRTVTSFGGAPFSRLVTRTSESRVPLPRKGEACAHLRFHSALRTNELRLRGVMALRKREGEMAKQKSGRRWSAVIALIAVLAALAGPSAALADSGSEYGFSDSYSFDVVASWVEE